MQLLRKPVMRLRARTETNKAIFSFNRRQRDRAITPQCDVNGTLCGTP